MTRALILYALHCVVWFRGKAKLFSVHSVALYVLHQAGGRGKKLNFSCVPFVDSFFPLFSTTTEVLTGGGRERLNKILASRSLKVKLACK